MTWQMRVWDSEGVFKETVPVDGAIEDLSSFSVDAAGNCTEATFTGVGADLPIRARDIIQLRIGLVAEPQDDSDWREAWKGVVTQAAPSRSRELREYRAVGLKQRFYEQHIEEHVIDGDDVAAMVLQLFPSDAYMPAGVTATTPADLGFVIGDRYPQLESQGDFLDALAETVGRFVVPAGETYTYKGRTYQAGEEVPAVGWGVDGRGRHFFERPTSNAIQHSEEHPRVLVTWEEVNGEEVYDRIHIVYATEYAPGFYAFFAPGGEYDPEVTPGMPIYTTVGEGEFDAARLVMLDAPLDYMVDTAAYIPPTSFAWKNPANAFDGDVTTYAESTPGELIGRADGSSAILRLRFQKATEGAEVEVVIRWYNPSTGAEAASAHYDFTDKRSVEPREFLAAALRPAGVGADEGWRVEARVSADDLDTRVYVLELYEPDLDRAETFAEGFMRGLEPNASVVRVKDSAEAPAHTMLLTPLGESEIEVPIERTEYHLSTSEGLITYFHIGQAHPSEELTEGVVLERLIRQGGRV